VKIILFLKKEVKSSKIHSIIFFIFFIIYGKIEEVRTEGYWKIGQKRMKPNDLRQWRMQDEISPMANLLCMQDVKSNIVDLSLVLPLTIHWPTRRAAKVWMLPFHHSIGDGRYSIGNYQTVTISLDSWAIF
jgi:hypothetical protein